MTAKNTPKSEADVKAVDTKDEKAPGDLQTTDEAVAENEGLPTQAEKTDDSKVEETVDLTDLTDDVVDEDYDGDDFGADGSVFEEDTEGEQYDVPYVNLTTTGTARTADSDDPAKDWTAQHASEDRAEVEHPVALVAVQGTPGQTFRVRELPDRAVLEAAGIDYDQFVAGLPVRPDVPSEAPRKGIPA